MVLLYAGFIREVLVGHESRKGKGGNSIEAGMYLW